MLDFSLSYFYLFIHGVFLGLKCTMSTLFCCSSGIDRLLLLLGEKPSSSNPSEGAACERVQQKAAVTLARLSRDPDVAQTAIHLKGNTHITSVERAHVTYTHWLFLDLSKISCIKSKMNRTGNSQPKKSSFNLFVWKNVVFF